MNWTTEKPTAPGWYWMRKRSQLGIAHISERTICDELKRDNWTGLWAQLTPGGVSLSLDTFIDWQFAGPIPEPASSERPSYADLVSCICGLGIQGGYFTKDGSFDAMAVSAGEEAEWILAQLGIIDPKTSRVIGEVPLSAKDVQDREIA